MYPFLQGVLTLDICKSKYFTKEQLNADFFIFGILHEFGIQGITLALL